MKGRARIRVLELAITIRMFAICQGIHFCRRSPSQVQEGDDLAGAQPHAHLLAYPWKLTQLPELQEGRSKYRDLQDDSRSCVVYMIAELRGILELLVIGAGYP